MLPTWTKAEKEAYDKARARAEREREHNQNWRDYMYQVSIADLAAVIYANNISEFRPEDAVEKAKEILALSGVNAPFQMNRTHDDDLKCC